MYREREREREREPCLHAGQQADRKGVCVCVCVCACVCACVRVCAREQMLCDGGANPNAQDIKGRTPLHLWYSSRKAAVKKQ